MDHPPEEAGSAATPTTNVNSSISGSAVPQDQVGQRNSPPVPLSLSLSLHLSRSACLSKCFVAARWGGYILACSDPMVARKKMKGRSTWDGRVKSLDSIHCFTC